jgi:hypothetical protein
MDNNSEAKVVSVDFSAFDSTISNSTHDLMYEVFSPFVTDKEMELWQAEAVIPSMSPAVHSGKNAIYLKTHERKSLSSGRFDTSVCGIFTGVYLGLLSEYENNYEGKDDKFESDYGVRYNIGDYGDDLQATTTCSVEDMDRVCGKYGFNLSAEPTSSHLKKIIDHDKNVVYNSFFSMFKNLVGPERPKYDKTTFALGIKSRLELAELDPLLKEPKVDALFKKILHWQGDFQDFKSIDDYLTSPEFKKDMDEYTKSAVKRSRDFTSIMAAATQGSFDYNDLSVEMQNILGLDTFEALNFNVKVDSLPLIKDKNNLEDVFLKVVDHIYFSDVDKNLRIDPSELLTEYFGVDFDSF